jgi:hypothetical protein
MDLKYTDNVMEWTRKLRTAGFAMQEAAAGACTFAAQKIASEYKVRLRTDTMLLRNEKFTLRSYVVYPARYKRSGGELRPMDDINAIVGVKKIGDKEHYLAMLEVGRDKKATGDIGVPIPVDSARGGNRRSPVKSAMRLERGTRYGGTVDLTRFSGNPRQQYAIMSSMARRGKLKNGSYYAVDQGAKKWLYKVSDGSVMITRDISEDIVKIQKNPMFERSVDRLKSDDMETYFSRAAMILMGSLS